MQGLLLLFPDKGDDFAYKNEGFYNAGIKKVLATISGMLWAKKYFYKEHCDMTWEELLTTKTWLWIDTRSSTDNTLQSSGKEI